MHTNEHGYKYVGDGVCRNKKTALRKIFTATKCGHGVVSTPYYTGPKWVLRSAKNSAQKIIEKYFSFRGGDFTPVQL